MEYKITQLTSTLYPKTTGLFETLQNLTQSKKLSTEKVLEIIQKNEKQDTTIFVALTNKNEIIATTKLIIEQKLTRNASKVGHIEDVVTKKGYEGKGIQSKIIETAIKHAKEKDCYKVILNCSQKNIPYYERFGFRQNEIEMRLDLF